MSSHDNGYLRGGKEMSAVADVSTAHRFTSAIEQAEARRLGLSEVKARPSVARRIGASPGTLENIRRLRIKSIPSWLMARIRTEFVAVLQAEITRLEHEICIARQIGTDHHDDVLAAAETQVASAKSLLSATDNPR